MKKASFVMIALVLIVGICSAETYDLDQVIRIGLDNVLDYKLELINSKYSKQQMTQSVIDLFPSVSASYNYSFGDEKKFFGMPGETGDAASLGYSVSKSFSLNDQSIFGYLTSKNDLKQSKISETLKKKDVVYSILSRYLNVVESQNALKIREENLKLEEKVFQETKILFDTDRKTSLDLKQAEISLINAKISLTEQFNSYRKLREDLLHYVGLPVDSVYFSDPQVEIKNTAPEYNESINMKISELELKNRKLNTLQNSLSIVPSISLSYNYNENAAYENVNDFLGLNLKDGEFSVGFGISYNFTDSYRDITNNIYTKNTLKHAEKQFEYDREQERIEYDQLLKDWQNLKHTYDLSTERLKLAEDNFKMSQEKYNLGMLSMIDLDNAKITLLDAKLSHNSTYFSLVQKYEELNLHVSGLILGKY